VFRCASPKYGPAVLKFGRPADIAAKFHTLRQYNGKRFCSVYEADLENGILLEEAVKPGTPLRNEPSLDNRLAVFCSLFEGLHIEADEAERFPTYTGWVDRIAEYMGRRRDCAELARHMQKAKDICLSLSAVYSRRMLLHGDFHHDNMLLAENGTYKIIDPKGVVGDPVFDVPRFVLNEFAEEITEETRRKINKILRVLGQKLRIPETVLKRCTYVETAMGACWSVEDGASPGEYPKLIRSDHECVTVLIGKWQTKSHSVKLTLFLFPFASLPSAFGQGYGKSRRNFRVSRGFPAAFRALSGGLSTHFHGFQATFHGGQLSTVFRRFSTHFHGFPAAFHGLSAAFRRFPDSGYRPRRMTGMACHAIVGLCQ